jgi:serine phosphatase RsbU (regulator of sigma subunit)
MPDKEWNEEITPFPLLNRPGGPRAQTNPVGSGGALLKTIKVLLIEDNRGDVRLIADFLAEVSGLCFEVESADRLAVGLARLGQPGIDIILLDLSLPDSRGLDTFLRVHSLVPRLPIVLLSGLDDETLAIKAVQKGAEDYLVKGHMDASHLVRAIRYAIERTRRRSAEQFMRATEVKLRMARQIQQNLFPAASPALPGFDIAGVSHCAEATGGDYFDYIPMLDDCLGIVIADVSGHGFGPALLMASTRAYLRALAQTHRSVGSILTLANRFLVKEVGEDGFITLLLARLNPRTRSLVYASAGHQTGYLFDPAGIVKQPLESTSFPLGVVPDDEFVDAPAQELQPGEIVLLLTDGILEARATDETPFGRERALEVIRSHRDRPASEIVAALCRSVRDFCKNKTLIDDVTAIVIKVVGA